MKIKNFVDKTTNFLFRRLSELSGLVLLVLSVLLLISLVSYSPEDPNFIFSENEIEVENEIYKNRNKDQIVLIEKIQFFTLQI